MTAAHDRTRNVPATCALCLKPAELQQSHVIPEFLFRTLYDDKHRLHQLSTSEAERNRYFQKGLRDRLLCSVCEERFSRYERYASLVLKGGPELTYEQDGAATIIAGVEYKPFRLFQLSILWRAHVSSLRFFRDVSLGPHAERLRSTLIREDPGPAMRYGCVMCALVHEGNVQEDLILQPERRRLGPCWAYRFVFGGLTWIYVISERNPKTGIEQGFLKEDGRLVVLSRPLERFPDLIHMGGTLQSQGKLG